MIIINVFYCPLQVRLKYRDLYYKYRQKVDLLKVLNQEYDQPLASEPSVLADFFDFLRSGGVKSGEQVVVVANSAELLPLLQRWTREGRPSCWPSCSSNASRSGRQTCC